jgi:hypothetical protein
MSETFVSKAVDENGDGLDVERVVQVGKLLLRVIYDSYVQHICQDLGLWSISCHTSRPDALARLCVCVCVCVRARARGWGGATHTYTHTHVLIEGYVFPPCLSFKARGQ